MGGALPEGQLAVVGSVLVLVVALPEPALVGVVAAVAVERQWTVAAAWLRIGDSVTCVESLG